MHVASVSGLKVSGRHERRTPIIHFTKGRARPKTKPQNARAPRKASDMSQDEAALVIQKQFRGYQARKEYGPLISSEKMSKEMEVFMKPYCRKWKAKSLFQVLLMYRATKHQETVYMAQQVHLYNQNAVSALQVGNKERVSLHNIAPDTTPSQFLGRFTPRPFKLPFRLNDMPFCDSSYLCTTMGKRTLTKDDAPWDDPYARRFRVLKATGRATDVEKCNIPVEEGTDVFGFIQTPYTRDPNYIEVVYSGQPYRKGDHFFTSKSGKERRNSRKKVAAPPAPNFNKAPSQFSNSNNGNNNRSVSPSYGKPGPSNGTGSYYQPPLPNTNFANPQSSGNGSNFVSDSGNGYRSTSPSYGRPGPSNATGSYYQPPLPNTNFVNPQSSGNGSNFVSDSGNGYSNKFKPAGIPANQKQNPIRELEMKFKQANNNNDEDNEDTPTFNFQAMLRKTNHNRASLRRSPEMETASNHGYGSFPIIPEQRSVNQTNNYMNSNNNNNNVIYNSSATRNKSGAPRPLLRQDSGDCRKAMSHHYKESAKKAKADEVTTEIAPGIIIQGQVAEL